MTTERKPARRDVLVPAVVVLAIVGVIGTYVGIEARRWATHSALLQRELVLLAEVEDRGRRELADAENRGDAEEATRVKVQLARHEAEAARTRAMFQRGRMRPLWRKLMEEAGVSP